MERLWLVGLVLVIEGCYAPGYRDCEITCTGGICPSGLACVDNKCRLGPVMQSCEAVLGDARMDTGDDAPPSDQDSDGDRVPDVDDNCPADMNTLQENEDGDALGDACDPCPILEKWGPTNASDANVDSDGDGVGDGCDPHPTINSERAMFFTGFNEMPAGTIATGIPYVINGGTATATVGANEVADLSITVTGFDPTRQLYLFTRETILGYSAVTIKASGAAMFVDPVADSGSACGPGEVGQTGTTGQLSLVQFSAAGDNQQSAATATTKVGTVFDTLMNRTGTTIFCSSPTIGGFSGPMAQPPTTIGIHARSMSVAFHYLYLVDSTSP